MLTFMAEESTPWKPLLSGCVSSTTASTLGLPKFYTPTSIEPSEFISNQMTIQMAITTMMHIYFTKDYKTTLPKPWGPDIYYVKLERHQ